MGKSETIELVFHGDKGVEIQTLLSSLDSVKKTIGKIARNNYGNETVEIYVKSIKPGSLWVVIETFVAATQSLLPALPFIGEFFTTIWELRKFLKGEKPASKTIHDNSVEIQNAEGNTYVFNDSIINFYAKDQSLEDGMAKMARALSKESQNSGLTIQASSGSMSLSTSLSQDDLKNASTPIPVNSISGGKRSYRSTEIVGVETVIFHGENSWSVSRPGQGKIRATILDKNFRDRVESEKVQFSAGTKMKVVLVTTVQVDEQNQDIPKTAKFEIEQVIEVISSSELVNMNIDDFQ